MKRYAVFYKEKNEYLPIMNGSTWWEPSFYSYYNYPGPRLFNSLHAARTFIGIWAKGPREKVYNKEGDFLGWKQENITNRKKEDLQILPVTIDLEKNHVS